MSYKGRDRGGFTGIEMLVVVAVLALVAGTAAGTHAYMKHRAIARVVAGDLDSYAQAQMGAWAETGRFDSYEQLLGTRFGGWSDDVELSEERTVGDRFFVRVRHTPTGYACALDLSPKTDRALNRKVCRASDADPALAVPPGVVVSRPPGDTTSVGRPPTTTPSGESVLLAPAVGDVGDVVLDPGTSRVVLFPVTNRSSEARTFRFSVSSNSDAVPTPSSPAEAQIEAGEVATIPLTVSVVAGTLADVFGDVELRAADAGDVAYMGSGGVRVRAALVLAAPLVAVPAAEVRDPGETFTVEYRVTNRTNAKRFFRVSASMPIGSALVLASPVADPAVDAFEERVVPVTYRLDPGADGGAVWSAQLVVADRDAPDATATSDPFEVTARLVLAAPTVAPVPSRTEKPGAEFTLTWQVTNWSNAPREFRVIPGSDSPELQTVSPSGVQRIGRGQVAAVPVTYRVAAGATCASVFTARLRVEDAGEARYVGMGAGVVNTATVVTAPAVVAPAARSDQPGTTFTVTWRVTNRTNCERDVRVDVFGDGDVVVSGLTPAGVVRMQPFEELSMDVSYELDQSSVYQTQSRPLVRATDEAGGAFMASGAFDHGTQPVCSDGRRSRRHPASASAAGHGGDGHVPGHQLYQRDSNLLVRGGVQQSVFGSRSCRPRGRRDPGVRERGRRIRLRRAGACRRRVIRRSDVSGGGRG